MILSAFIENEVESCAENIPKVWERIKGTPFLQVTMTKGKEIFIHTKLKVSN
jgi:hypothetical protein